MRYLFYFLHLVGSNRTLDTFCQNESKNNNNKAILLLDENLTDDSNSVFVSVFNRVRFSARVALLKGEGALKIFLAPKKCALL